MTEQEDVLAHFGVKGMKWGVRKATTRGSTPPSKRSPKNDSEKKSGSSSEGPSRSGKEKRQSLDMHSMSDAELRNAINRIKMQKEYAQLTAPPPKEKSQSRQLVENIVFSSAEAAGKKVLTGALTSVLENALPSALRGKPEKSKTDQIAEKVLKGMNKQGGNDGESNEAPRDRPRPTPPPGPQRPQTGGPVPARPSPSPSGGGRRSAPPRHSAGTNRGNPFRRKKSGSTEAPSVTVPDATVRSKSSGESASRPPIAALPRKPSSTQGRPGSSGSGREYDNDSSSTDRKGSGATQGRPGTTDQRKKRRFRFGHGDLDGIIVDILDDMD